MNIFEGKTIIMGVPKLFNFDSLIDAELKAVGFKTINISVHNNTFRYKNIFERLENFIAKRFFGNRQYKQYLNFKQAKKSILNTLQNVHDADYILIIRPEVYPYSFLKELKKRGKKMIGYQWNGLNRQPQTRKYIPLFDKFYVFDGVDLKEPSVLPLTNFYPTTIEASVNESDRSDVFYVGSYYGNRIEAFCDMLSKCEALKLHVRYHLFSKGKKKSVPCNLTVTKDMLSYEQSIQYTYNTRILLDLKVDEHEGLSFRVLESVGLGKKIITTNCRVRDYDFFNPDNILIWNGQSIEELKAFVDKPYMPVADHIKKKYSFKNWIQYVLGEGNYIPITLPQ